MVWLGWVEAAALLGMAELGPRVRKAIDNFWVPAGLMEFEDFEQQLHYAKHHSYAPWRNDADFAPFGDAVDELARYVVRAGARGGSPSGSAAWMIRSSTNTTFRTSSLW